MVPRARGNQNGSGASGPTIKGIKPRTVLAIVKRIGIILALKARM